MYISDKAVQCDNKILFNPVTYILLFVRFHAGAQLKTDGLGEHRRGFDGKGRGQRYTVRVTYLP